MWVRFGYAVVSEVCDSDHDYRGYWVDGEYCHGFDGGVDGNTCGVGFSEYFGIDSGYLGIFAGATADCQQFCEWFGSGVFGRELFGLGCHGDGGGDYR